MQCRPQYQQQHSLQNHFQWCQTVLTLPVSSTQGRTAIAACPLQLRGSPAEFESQTWIDEHMIYEKEDKQASSTRHHPAPDGGPPRLNGDLLPHLTDGLRQRTKSSSHLFIIVTSGDSIIIVDRFPPWSWLECLVCCVAIVWSGGAKISDEKCNLLGKTVRFGKVCLWYDIGPPSFALVRTYDIVCSKFGQSKSRLMRKVHSALWENLVIWRSLAWAAGCQSLINLQRDLHKK